jgi:Mor family transcriptional regulator
MARKTREVFDFLVQIAGINIATEMFKRFRGEIATIWNEDSEFCKVLVSISDKSVLKDFMEEFNREQLYIGNVNNFFLDSRNEEIIRKYDGTNIKNLVKEFGLSEARIGRIVKDKREKFKNI